jgi:WD40 repeat protein
MATSRTIRLFVSSTFADMKAERDTLQREVFPKLKQLCLSKGLRFQAIDLRWGVSEEAGRHNRTMRICLRELQRCQEGTPKPNFLILLGDRYGWRPLPETIPADLFDRLKEQITVESVETANLLSTCYRRDNNAVPPAYILQPRQDDDARWYGIVEPTLLSRLQSAAVAIGSDPHLEALAIGLSATHQEIIHGALAVPDAREHVHAFFRMIRNPPGQPPAKDFMDRLPNGAPDPDAPTQLTRLKEKVTGHIGTSNTHRYTLDWREEGNFTDPDLAGFREGVYRALESVILNQISQLESIPNEEQEENAHRDFGQERRDGFVGRGELLDRVAAHLATGTGRPLAVVGSAGSGKSAFMAKAVEQARAAHPKATIIERYIGASPASSDLVTLLRNVVAIIRRKFPAPTPKDPEERGERDEDIPFEIDLLIAALQEALRRPTAAAPLYLFLDALDQLSDTHQAHQLNWLSSTIPQHMRLIVSTVMPEGGDGSPSHPPMSTESERSALAPNQDASAPLWRALDSRIAVDDRILLDKLRREYGEQMLDHRLNGLRRTLQPEQREAVLRTFAIEGSPLWLRAATTEAARYADWQTLLDFPPDMTGLMHHILEKLSAEEDHGEMLVSRALGYLACARHGLAEDEMLDVLSADQEVMENFRQRHPKSPPVQSLPVAVWVAFRGDVAGYLAEHDAQQARLIRFYHRQLADVAAEDYLARDGGRAGHRALACYFGDRPLHAGGDRLKAIDLRKVSELPFQRTHAEMWDELEELLCNLEFIEAKCAAGMTYDLLADYDRALDRWVGHRRDDVFGPPPDPVSECLRESTAEVLAGTRTSFAAVVRRAFLTRIFGSRAAEDDPEEGQKPMHSRGEQLPDGYFGVDRGAAGAMDAMRRTDTALARPVAESIISTPAGRVEVFARFVSSYAHVLVRDATMTAGLAHNSAADGPIASAATNVISSRGPLLLRRGRPAFAQRPALLRTIEVDGDIDFPLAITPDGRIAVYGTWHPHLVVLDLTTGATRKTIGQTERLRAIALSPDARTAVTAGGDLCVWDLVTGLCRRTLGAKAAICVAMTADARIAISIHEDDRSLRVWDLTTGRCARMLPGHYGGDAVVAITPDGRFAVSGARDGSVSLWDVSNSLRRWTHRGHFCNERRKGVGAVAITADGRLAVSGGEDGQVHVWDVTRAKRLRTFTEHSLDGTYVRTVALSPDGRLLITGGNDGKVRAWDLGDGNCIQTIDTTYVIATAVAASGRLVVWASGNYYSKDKRIHLWDVTGTPVAKTAGSYGGPVVLKGRGSVVSASTSRGTVRFWDYFTGTCARSIDAHSQEVTGLAAACNGKAVSASRDDSVHVWGLSDGDSERVLPSSRGTYRLAAVANNRIVVGWEWKGNALRSWDVESGTFLRLLDGHDETSFVDAGLDGRLLVSTGTDEIQPDESGQHEGDHTFRVWDLATGTYLTVLRAHFEASRHTSGARDWGLSPDGRLMLSATDEGLRLQSLNGASSLIRTPATDELKRRSTSLSILVVAPHGRLVVTGSHDGVIRAWDLVTKECRWSRRVHDGLVSRIVIRSDGRVALSGGQDTTLYMWDVGTGKQVAAYATNPKTSALPGPCCRPEEVVHEAYVPVATRNPAASLV